jgi:hypothetical protein
MNTQHRYGAPSTRLKLAAAIYLTFMALLIADRVIAGIVAAHLGATS